MCGIVGYIGFGNQKPIDSELVVKMNDSLSHRGPDGEGFYFCGALQEKEHYDYLKVTRPGAILIHENGPFSVALGHRRLSILDLNPLANQPMCDADHDIWIVFNGEIYNHQQIKKELQKKYTFKTNHSDTETIIYAYKNWGIEAIHRFNGFFAFALFDKKRGEIYLVRDRLGKKPLYYVRNDEELYFSSEIHPFFVDDGKIVKKEINPEALYHYLTFLTVHAPNTFFKNVQKLESGYYLKISFKSIQKRQYWNIANFINNENNDSLETAIEKTELLFSQSIEYRNISDVGVAVALSGGLDSSLNLYYSKKANGDIRAINVVYEKENQYNESIVAKKFANEQSTAFIENIIDDITFEKIVREYIDLSPDQPLGDINASLVYLISTLSRKSSAPVLIVGEGGDEIGGYPIYATLLKQYQLLKYFSAISELLKYLPYNISKRLDFFYRGKVISRRHIHGFSEREKRSFLFKNDSYNSYEVLGNYMSEIRDDLKDSFLRKILNVEYKLRLPELILARIDYPAMAASVEARSPFMDHELIEYSASLSFDVKMKNGAKTILRKIAEEKLPSYILTHPKVGFGMLLTPFLQNTMPVWFEGEFIHKQNPMHQYIKPSFFKDILNQHKKNKNYGYKMWILYALSRWLSVNNFDA
jgi:asparagine synthase (glutamine-hydrolysing)